jgi:Acetyltransferases
MTDAAEKYTVREYREEDIPALVDLWVDVFGDSRHFVEEFFRLLPNMGSCILLEDETGICAEASVITGCDILSPGVAEGPVIGYIYAVAVKESVRGKGYGEEICRSAYALAEKREADIVCTLPADAGLYDFYAKALGFECVLHRKRCEIPASPDEMTMKLTATEYSMFRNSMLSERRHLHPSFFTMEFVKNAMRGIWTAGCLL